MKQTKKHAARLLTVLTLIALLSSCGSYRGGTAGTSGLESSLPVSSASESPEVSSSEPVSSEMTSSAPESVEATPDAAASTAPDANNELQQDSQWPDDMERPSAEPGTFAGLIGKNIDSAEVTNFFGAQTYYDENVDHMYAYEYAFEEKGNPGAEVFSMASADNVTVRVIYVHFKDASDNLSVNGITKNDTPETLQQKLGTMNSFATGNNNSETAYSGMLGEYVSAVFYFNSSNQLTSATVGYDGTNGSGYGGHD